VKSGAEQKKNGATKVAQLSPGATKVAQLSPGATWVAQLSPGATKVAQLSPGATKVAQLSPGATKVAQLSPPFFFSRAKKNGGTECRALTPQASTPYFVPAVPLLLEPPTRILPS